VIVSALRMIAILTASLVLSDRAVAADFPVQEARAVDGNTLCRAHSNWLITEVSGPCSGFTPPSKLAVGEAFVANGKTRTIAVITATQREKDYKDDKIDAKKGEWYCVAGETVADLDIEHNKNALWLYVPKCEPVSPKLVGPVQIFTLAEFLKLPDGLQAVFIGGLIEGMAFISYGYSLPDHEAWTACVRQKTIGDTVADVVAFLKQDPGFNESIASAFAKVIGKRCKH
jgi:hypothetical protein